MNELKSPAWVGYAVQLSTVRYISKRCSKCYRRFVFRSLQRTIGWKRTSCHLLYRLIWISFHSHPTIRCQIEIGSISDLPRAVTHANEDSERTIFGFLRQQRSFELAMVSATNEKAKHPPRKRRFLNSKYPSRCSIAICNLRCDSLERHLSTRLQIAWKHRACCPLQQCTMQTAILHPRSDGFKIWQLHASRTGE